MKNKRVIWSSLLASAVLGVFLYAWARPVVPGDQGRVRQVAALFTGNPVSDGGDFSESDISKQHRFVEVKPATMEALANGADRVRLQLLDGREYTVLLTAREDGPVASVATGELEGVPDSQVILSTASDDSGARKISGKFTMADGRVYQLTPTANGHCLFELDRDNVHFACEPQGADRPVGSYRANGETIQVARQSVSRRFLRGRKLLGGGNKSSNGSSSGSSGGRNSKKGGSSKGSGSSSKGSGSRNGTSKGSGSSKGGGSKGGGSSSSGGASTIDIVVMYTTKAASDKGGDAGIKSHIGAAVADVNKAFKSSQIKTTVKLVGTGKMDYDSKGNLGGALGKLRGDKAAKSLQQSKNADLLSLMVTGNSGGAAGVGSVMPSVKGNKGACYSVVHQKYAIGYHSFAHELGHNLGSLHCWDQSGKGVKKYSHGHRWKGSDGKGYRSIMSYGKNGDKRTGYFSNPKVSYKGKATGDATKADNAKTFGETAPAVSKYR